MAELDARPREDGWRELPFEELASSVSDRVDDPSTAGVDRYVGLEHLDPGQLRITRWGRPDDVEATKLRFEPGDVILGRRRVYQRKVAVADFEGICSAHALVLRARPNAMLPELLPFFLQREEFFDRALRISVGSLSPTINWKTLAKERFVVPPLERQASIAALLRRAWQVECRWGDVIFRQRAAFAGLQAHLFSHLRHGRQCGDVLEVAKAGGTPSRQQPSLFDGDIPWLKSGEVEPGVAETEESISSRALEASAAWVVPEGAVVVAMYGATAGQVGTLARPMATNQAVLSLLAAPDLADQRFLFHWLLARSPEMKRRAVGAAQPNLSKQRVLEEPFPEIGVKEQRRIARRLDDTVNVGRQFEAHASSSHQLTAALRETLLAPD